jgi:hypothetical protein
MASAISSASLPASRLLPESLLFQPTSGGARAGKAVDESRPGFPIAAPVTWKRLEPLVDGRTDDTVD